MPVLIQRIHALVEVSGVVVKDQIAEQTGQYRERYRPGHIFGTRISSESRPGPTARGSDLHDPVLEGWPPPAQNRVLQLMSRLRSPWAICGRIPAQVANSFQESSKTFSYE
jgi:hypothetical protein